MSTEIKKSRIIKMFTTVNNAMTDLETSATTWGELKTQVAHNNMEIWVKDLDANNRYNLQLDDQLIPKNAVLLITPKKQKSGMATNYDKLSYNDLRKLVKQKNLADGLGSNPTKVELIAALNTKLEKVSTKNKAKVVEEVKVAQKEVTLEAHKSEVDLKFKALFNAALELAKAVKNEDSSKAIAEYSVDKIKSDFEGIV